MTQEFLDPAMLFATTIRNETDQPINVREYETHVASIPPGKNLTLYAMVPSTSYARWSEIVYLAEGGVRLVENPRWAMPPSWKDKYVLEVLNDLDTDELMRVGDARYTCFPHLPRLIPCELDEPLVFVKRIHVHSISEIKPDLENPGYVKRTKTIARDRELRPVAELREIKEALELRAIKNVEDNLRLPPDVEALLK